MTKTATIREIATRVLEGVRSEGILIIGFFFLLAVFFCQTSISAEGQIVIYLELAGKPPPALHLIIDSVTLGSGASGISLPMLDADLGSDYFSSGKVMLSEQYISEGFYDTLYFAFKNDFISGAEKALIDSGPDTFAVPLNLVLKADAVEPLFIRLIIINGSSKDSLVSLRAERYYPDIPPSGSLIFVANEESNNLTVINRFTLEVIDILGAGTAPRGLAYSPESRQLFIANSGDNTVSVVDVDSRDVLRLIQLYPGDHPSRLALSSDERYLYILNYGTDCLSVYDIASFRELDRQILGEGVTALTVSAVSGKVYVSNSLSDNIIVYDPSNPSARESYAISGSPGEIVLSENGGSLFCGLGDQRSLTTLDLNMAGINVISGLCSSVTGVEYDRSLNLLYAGLDRCGEIAVIRPGLDLILDNVVLMAQPGLITLDQNRNMLLAVLPKDNKLAVINTTRRGISGYLNVGRKPYMALAQE